MADILVGEVVAGQGTFLLRERNTYRVKVDDMRNQKVGETIPIDNKNILN